MAEDVDPPSHPLFPIPLSRSGYSGLENEQRAPSYLFPCIDSSGNDRYERKDRNKEWLTNSSFRGSDVQRFNNVEDCARASSSDESASEAEACNADSGDEREPERIDKRRKRRRKHSDSESSSSPAKEKGKSKHKKKHKKHKHKRKLKSEGGLSKEEQTKPNTIWIEECGFPLEKAFRVHTKADRENLMYGGLYRLDIASYKLRPNISCLGLGKNQSVTLTELKKNKRKRQGVIRYWNSEDLMMNKGSAVQLPGKAVSSKELETPGFGFFVPLESASLSENRAEDTKNTTDDGQNTEIVSRTREFNTHLQDNPQDIETWLAFAKFQEETVEHRESTVSTFSESGNAKHMKSSIVLVEKKVAILEKALEQNPSSVELIITYLELCSEIWETEKLVEKWKRVIFTQPNKALLWKHYLCFVQSRYAAFSVSKVQSAYHKCMTTLSSIQEGTFTSHQAEGDIEKDMLDLFIQMCQFFRQSGHTEKAVASFQAMVELNCCCPTTLEQSTPTSGQIAFLETFWDSGEPRFGEEGASGLKTWMENSEASSTPAADTTDLSCLFKSKRNDQDVDGRDEEDMTLDQDKPTWQTWLEVETRRESRHIQSWQPNKSAGQTEEDCEDPERLVLFDDISSSLFKLNDPGHKLTLILCFLECLGVPVPCLQSTASSNIQSYFSLHTCHEEQVLGPPISLYSQCLGLQRFSKWTTDTDGSRWPSQQLYQLIRGIFCQSLSVFSGEARSLLMTIWLRFEFYLSQQQTSPKEKKQKYKDVRKLARALLKQPSNRNDVMLWQTFAEMEWASGNREEAQRIFDATLSMGSEMFSVDEKKREVFLPMFRSYAELEMGLLSQNVDSKRPDDCTSRALHVLTSYAEGSAFKAPAPTPVSPVRVLKARKLFQQAAASTPINPEKSQQKESVVSPVGSYVVHLTACHALFEYLTTGIDGVVTVYDEALSKLRNSPLDRELVWTSYVRLLNFHSSTQSISLKFLRRVVTLALEEFPDNPEFLGAYVQLEIKSNVSSQARRFLDKATQKSSSPASWLFALQYEQQRSKTVLSVRECLEFIPAPNEFKQSRMVTSLPANGITHRQRSLFVRALVHPQVRHCVALWRMYMEFEMQNGGRDRAKSVFYQALQHCPWAKELYMDALRHFPQELEDIMDLMTEKGLRVRTPLEEIQVLLEE